jgi:pyridoxine 4-dehydrogenase
VAAAGQQDPPRGLIAGERRGVGCSASNRYNVADRSAAEVLAVCERERLAFISWAPIAGGSRDKVEGGAGSNGLDAVAKARGVSVWQAAIAWLLAAID